MITKISLSYLLLFTTMLGAGIVMNVAEIDTPKWFLFLFGLLTLMFPLLLVGVGFYWIWSE